MILVLAFCLFLFLAFFYPSVNQSSQQSVYHSFYPIVFFQDNFCFSPSPPRPLPPGSRCVFTSAWSIFTLRPRSSSRSLPFPSNPEWKSKSLSPTRKCLLPADCFDIEALLFSKVAKIVFEVSKWFSVFGEVLNFVFRYDKSVRLLFVAFFLQDLF